MPSSLSHSVYTQLRKLHFVQKRQARILDSAQIHFGKEKIQLLLESKGFRSEAPCLSSADEIKLFAGQWTEPELLRALARLVFFEEANLVKILREGASPFTSHTEEQVLFAARNAGQDTARDLLWNRSSTAPGLDAPSLFHNIDSVWFRGLPEDNCCFVSMRPHAHVSFHWETNPHADAWMSAGADLQFQERIENEWLGGILDVLSPDHRFIREKSLAKGDHFGLGHIIESRRLNSQV